MYGIQGANGVLVITTKRGQPGRTKIEASFDQSFQQWITHPRIYSSWEYATMRRQAAINDGLSGDQLPFTEEQIAQFSDEQLATIEARYAELKGEEPAEEPEEDVVDNGIVDFTDVAPFLEPVQGETTRNILPP